MYIHTQFCLTNVTVYYEKNKRGHERVQSENDSGQHKVNHLPIY